MVSFPYASQLVEKVKTIDGRKWHKNKKYWSFPNTNGTFEKILKAFEGEKIHIDLALQTQLSTPVIAMPKHRQKQSQQFEDLRRELLSKKYSYKTVKGYIYYKSAKERKLRSTEVKNKT